MSGSEGLAGGCEDAPEMECRANGALFREDGFQSKKSVGGEHTGAVGVVCWREVIPISRAEPIFRVIEVPNDARRSLDVMTALEGTALRRRRKTELHEGVDKVK
jgi:hypothetical protein